VGRGGLLLLVLRRYRRWQTRNSTRQCRRADNIGCRIRALTFVDYVAVQARVGSSSSRSSRGSTPPSRTVILQVALLSVILPVVELLFVDVLTHVGVFQFLSLEGEGMAQHPNQLLCESIDRSNDSPRIGSLTLNCPNRTWVECRTRV
jgi:hypothetical protein